jgi:peptidoglycan/LPS O-acetylase OafA/YrhL
MIDKKRLYYLDNLKVFLIALVIVHHVGQAYGSTGGVWFYSFPGERVKSLGLFFLFNASFFMGLFFFISGYFLPGSFDRHGAREFIADKLLRFGIPLVFASLIMIPLIDYVRYLHYVNPISFKDFYIEHWFGFGTSTANHQREFNFAHLWFIEHLLIYSILYVAVRIVLQRWAPSISISGTLRARLYVIILYIIILGIVTNLVRTQWGFPMDRWIGLLGFIQVEPAHIPQYLSLFIAGILSYRWALLDSVTMPRNILWLVPGVGIYIVTIAMLYSVGPERAFFVWELKEALLCVGVCIGLLALFKTFFNRTGRIMQVLSENTFAVYILHVPVVVALQYAFDPVQIGPLTLFIIVSILSIIGSFSTSSFIRLIPVIRRVL